MSKCFSWVTFRAKDENLGYLVAAIQVGDFSVRCVELYQALSWIWGFLCNCEMIIKQCVEVSLQGNIVNLFILQFDQAQSCKIFGFQKKQKLMSQCFRIRKSHTNYKYTLTAFQLCMHHFLLFYVFTIQHILVSCKTCALYKFNTPALHCQYLHFLTGC